jgi:nitrogen regulatory protein PII-like uncharacterized protein
MKKAGIESIRVHLIDLPDNIKGFTVREDIDSYDIYIDASLCDSMICTVYDHEIEHINNHDFDKMYSVSDLEETRSA